MSLGDGKNKKTRKLIQNPRMNAGSSNLTPMLLMENGGPLLITFVRRCLACCSNNLCKDHKK